MQVSRSSDKQEIMWDWEPGARVAEEHRRLRPFGNPPPVVGAGASFMCCRLPEQLPMSLGIIVYRAELRAFLVFCNSSGIIVL